MKDASSTIVTAILLLLSVLLVWGWNDWYSDTLEVEMRYHEEVWERAREGNRLMGCFRSGYQELYLIDDTLMTGKAEKSFRECVR